MPGAPLPVSARHGVASNKVAVLNELLEIVAGVAEQEAVVQRRSCLRSSSRGSDVPRSV